MFTSVVWPKGQPPSDKPECGFNNELCEWLTNGNLTNLLLHQFMLNIQAKLTTSIIYCLDGTQTSPCWPCLSPSLLLAWSRFCALGSSLCRNHDSRRGLTTPAGGSSTTATSLSSESTQYEQKKHASSWKRVKSAWACLCACVVCLCSPVFFFSSREIRLYL